MNSRSWMLIFFLLLGSCKTDQNKTQSEPGYQWASPYKNFPEEIFFDMEGNSSKEVVEAELVRRGYSFDSSQNAFKQQKEAQLPDEVFFSVNEKGVETISFTYILNEASTRSTVIEEIKKTIVKNKHPITKENTNVQELAFNFPESYMMVYFLNKKNGVEVKMNRQTH